MLDLKARIGERCKELRVAAKLDVRKAAAAMRMSELHLYAVERGEKGASLDLLLVMSYVYGVDVADFFTFPEINVRHRLRELLRLTPAEELDEFEQAFAQHQTRYQVARLKKYSKRR